MTIIAVMVIIPEIHVTAVLALMKAMSVSTVMAATYISFLY